MSLFAYVTLAEAKTHLRIATADTYDDDYVQNLIYTASQAVKTYLGDRSVYRPALDDEDEPTELDSNGFPEPDSWGSQGKPEIVLPTVKHAVLLIIGELYRYRDTEENNADPNYLSRPVRALLYPLRQPSVT